MLADAADFAEPLERPIWALLTGGIGIVEREQAARGSNTPHFDAMLANLSRLLAIAVKWAIGHGHPTISPLERSWTHELAAAVDRALSLATQYSHFEVCFLGFHKDRYAVDVITPTSLRFAKPFSLLTLRNKVNQLIGASAEPAAFIPRGLSAI